MINELSEILITAISAVSGTGGIAGVLLWKHNKKVRKKMVVKAGMKCGAV